MRVALACLAAFFALQPAAAPAQDYFPLSEAMIREYFTSTPNGSTGSSTRVFMGTTVMHNTTVSILQHSGGLDDNLLQFWSKTAEGNLLFHGFSVPGFTNLWTPPFLMLDLPLTVGKTWNVSSAASAGGSVQLNFQVMATESTTTPAGTFDVVVIDMAITAAKSAPGSRLEQLGTFGTAMAPDVWRYADQAGLVRAESPVRIDTLTSLQVVAVEATSWSRIRALYR